MDRLLGCGCIVGIPEGPSDPMSIDRCDLHQAAGALRNALRWLRTNADLSLSHPEAPERVRYALEAAGDKL